MSHKMEEGDQTLIWSRRNAWQELDGGLVSRSDSWWLVGTWDTEVPQKKPSRKQNDSQWQNVSCEYET